MNLTLTRTGLLGGLLVLLMPGLGLAQRRFSNPLEERAELQLELALPNNHYFWTSLHTQHGIGTSDAGLFRYNWVQGGYEHFWSEHWSAGGNLRLAFYEQFGATDVSNLRLDVRPEVLLRHRGNLLGLTFGQRLSVEYAFLKQRNVGATRLRLDLERSFRLGEQVRLRPRVAYEAAANIRLQPPEDAPEERTIDQGIWRAEVGLRLSDHFDLTPYVARQTDHRIFLFQYDANGNITAGGRTNVRRPIIGLDLRYTLFEGSPFERIQLPTQH